MTFSPRHVLILEVTAFVAMVIDHAAKARIYSMPGWEIVGRVAFPLFAMTFAFNAATYQRCNIRKLVVLGCLAAPGMAYLLGERIWQPNIMFAFPVGWLAFRFFADKQETRSLLLKALGLCLMVSVLSLGSAYDVRGVALIALAIGCFSVARRGVAVLCGVGACLCFASTLLATPYKIVPVTLLLLAIIGLAMCIPAGNVVRRRDTVWDRAGFGKWYVVHAYLLSAFKFGLNAIQ